MSAPNVRVVLSARARRDLRSIALYGSVTWGEERASRYLADITELLVSLSHFPELGRRTNLLAGEARAISVGSHVVYYVRDPDEIRIVRVLHERTQPDDQLE